MKSFARRPIAVAILILLHAILGIGAVFGGGALILDPSGAWIGMPVDMMKVPWFKDYLIPGILLFTVLGIGPLLVMFALINRWNCKWAEKLNIFRTAHWAWSYSLYCAFALQIWISVQIFIIHDSSVIHLVYMGLGLVIQTTTLLPSVSKYYST